MSSSHDHGHAHSTSHDTGGKHTIDVTHAETRDSDTSDHESAKKFWTKIGGILAMVAAAIYIWMRVQPYFFDDTPSEERSTVANLEVQQVQVVSQTRAGNIKRETFVIEGVNDWSTPTRVGSGYCFYALVEKFGLPGHKTQVSYVDQPSEDDWVDITEKAEKPIRWVRHGSKGPGGTEVVQEIRPDGSCG